MSWTRWREIGSETEETMSKTFTKSMKILITDLISHIIAMWVSLKKKRYKIHITVKMINIKVKEKILRAAREERDYNQNWHGNCQLTSHPKRKRQRIKISFSH